MMHRYVLHKAAVMGVASICFMLAMPAEAQVCGDLNPDLGEQCDDGNTASGDGCDATCQVEIGFDCSGAIPGDLTNNPPVSPIPSACIEQFCSDSIQSSNEACDDGNLIPGDGCSATCQVEGGFACTAATDWLDYIFGEARQNSSCQQGLVCDVDLDNDVDRADIRLIFGARNMPASGADDPRDANGDGTITVRDGRACVLQCTLPRCAEL